MNEDDHEYEYSTVNEILPCAHFMFIRPWWRGNKDMETLQKSRRFSADDFTHQAGKWRENADLAQWKVKSLFQEHESVLRMRSVRLSNVSKVDEALPTKTAYPTPTLWASDVSDEGEKLR